MAAEGSYQRSRLDLPELDFAGQLVWVHLIGDARRRAQVLVVGAESNSTDHSLVVPERKHLPVGFEVLNDDLVGTFG
jgi:hypothetical protein